MSQVTSRMEGDTADTLILWGATDGAAAEEMFYQLSVKGGKQGR